MSTFYLIRHGTRVDRSEDTALSDVGLQQAQKTAQYFHGREITAVYASPMKRAQQTAQAIADQLNALILTDARLLERMIYDGRAGDTFDEFLQEWDKTMGDRNYQPTYGDTAYRAGARLQSLLDELPDHGNYIIVSHSGVIGDVLRNLFSDELLTFQNDPAKSLSWVVVPECSISEIIREGGSYRLKRVSDVSHLDEAFTT